MSTDRRCDFTVPRSLASRSFGHVYARSLCRLSIRESTIHRRGCDQGGHPRTTERSDRIWHGRFTGYVSMRALPEDLRGRCEALSVGSNPSTSSATRRRRCFTGCRCRFDCSESRTFTSRRSCPRGRPVSSACIGHAANPATCRGRRSEWAPARERRPCLVPAAPAILTLDELVVAGDRLLGRPRPLATRGEIAETMRAYGQSPGCRRLRAAALADP